MADMGEWPYILFTFATGYQCFSKSPSILLLWQTFLGYYSKDTKGKSDETSEVLVHHETHND